MDRPAILFYDIAIDLKKGGKMATTTISPKYRVVIPKEIREKLHLKSGEKMTVLTKGGGIYFIPEKSLETFKGFLKGGDTQDIGEDSDWEYSLLIHPAG
jgi:AbrB family looped-hinge helix DNA binding protein